MYEIVIRKGKEKILVRHNPWVFTGAIKKVSPSFTDAGLAEVLSEDGQFIAYGWYDEKSHITLHLLSWNRRIIPDDGWLEERINDAVRRRKVLASSEDTDAMRLIHGEADFIPGLALDIYNGHLKAIISSRYAQDHLDVIRNALQKAVDYKTLTIIPDSFYAPSEGLSRRILSFDRDGNSIENGKENIRFRESGIYYEIEPGISQKSGFYCDQRDNRNIVEKYANGRTVLDACSFTGAFTLHCLRGRAESVHAVDSSQSALRHLLYQIHLNENEKILPSGSREKVTIEEANVFEYMRSAEENRYDMIILDPPKLASTKSKLENALKAYKDLNRMAMLKIKPDGIIATFSCSGSLTKEAFRMMVSYAASDAGVEIQILEQMSAGCDHPVRISLPESEYLKGLLIRVIK